MHIQQATSHKGLSICEVRLNREVQPSPTVIHSPLSAPEIPLLLSTNTTAPLRSASLTCNTTLHVTRVTSRSPQTHSARGSLRSRLQRVTEQVSSGRPRQFKSIRPPRGAAPPQGPPQAPGRAVQVCGSRRAGPNPRGTAECSKVLKRGTEVRDTIRGTRGYHRKYGGTERYRAMTVLDRPGLR